MCEGQFLRFIYFADAADWLSLGHFFQYSHNVGALRLDFCFGESLALTRGVKELIINYIHGWSAFEIPNQASIFDRNSEEAELSGQVQQIFGC
jgi:hypothetical protein